MIHSTEVTDKTLRKVRFCTPVGEFQGLLYDELVQHVKKNLDKLLSVQIVSEDGKHSAIIFSETIKNSVLVVGEIVEGKPDA